MSDQRNTVNRRNVLKGVGLASVASMSGCITGGNEEGGDGGAGTTSGTGSGNTAPEMADSIEAWSWDVAAKSLNLTDEPYEEALGGDVTIQQFGRADMKKKYKSKMLSGSGAPTVATMESVDAAAWVGTDGLRDIQPWIQDAGVKDDFVSGKWEPLTADGGTYALPWDIGPVGTFYRQDVLQKHDVDISSAETWDQFIEEGKKLPDDVSLLNLPANDQSGLWRMLYRMEGGMPFNENGDIAFHNDKSVRIAQTIKQVSDSGIAANLSTWSSSWFNAFKQGTVASLNAGAWMEGTLKAELPGTSGKWRVRKPPALSKGGPRATNWGGSNLVISDSVSDAEARRGWDYMKFTLANKEMQTKMYDEYGLFPAYKPAYQSDAFSKKNEFLGGQKAGELFAEIAPDIPPYRFSTATPEVSEAINTHFSNMLKGQYSPEKAVEKAAKQVADRTGRSIA